MTVYAIFMCVAWLQTCQPEQPVNGPGMVYVPPPVYATLEDCLGAIAAHGFPTDPTKDVYYQCWARHVDTWQQP